METAIVENNFLTFLSESHYDFMVRFLELEQQREEAVLDNFFLNRAAPTALLG
jgi:hypothetical protein